MNTQGTPLHFANRRGFLVATALVGGGMAFGFGSAVAAEPVSVPWAADDSSGAAFSAWLEIAPDDTVTMHVPEPETGNGAVTGVAMTIAEELDCNWDKVRTVFASVQRNHFEKGVYAAGFQPFFGGHSTQPPRFQLHLQLGASARERLKAAASAHWGVPVAEISTEASLLTHRLSGRTIRYGEVAAAAARIVLPAEPQPRPRSEWRLIGHKSLPKLHIPQIVRGEAMFGIDVRVPGMVHAALRQCPVHGGRLKNYDAKAVMGMPGVRAVVPIDPANTRGSPVPQKSTFGLQDSLAQHGIAVIADHYWQARQALEKLPVEWDFGAGAQWADEGAVRAAAAARWGAADARVLATTGDVAAASGKRVVAAEFATPWCDNAAMEPLNATVMVTADSVEAWAPSQDQQQAFWVLVDETGLPPEKVRFHQTMVGGAFGRRGQGDDLRMAAAVARQYPGRPVKVIWTREETFTQGRYRTPITARFKATLDDITGLPQAVVADAAYTGTSQTFQLPLGYADYPYFHGGAIPATRMTSASLPVHVLNGAWRGPCYNSFVFFIESFIDECAHAAGADPLDYRLKLLAHWEESWSACLRLVAERAGWGRKLPRGQGIGLAVACWPLAGQRKGGTVVATAVRVEVSKRGDVAVRQIDVAFDCGSVQNPDAVRAQLEGATLFGLNAALSEELTLKDGAVVEGNFDAYPMLRMADAPPVNVHFEALSGDARMAIIGEAGVGPVQPALANAIFAATGKRLRQTPFRKTPPVWS